MRESGGHRLGLRAAGQHYQAFRIEGLMSCGRTTLPSGMRNFPEPVRYLDVVHHAAPDESNFSSDLAAISITC